MPISLAHWNDLPRPARLDSERGPCGTITFMVFRTQEEAQQVATWNAASEPEALLYAAEPHGNGWRVTVREPDGYYVGSI